MNGREKLVRSLRESRFVAASLGVHAIAAAVLLAARPYERAWERRPIHVEILRRPERKPAPPVETPRPAPPIARATERTPSRAMPERQAARPIRDEHERREATPEEPPVATAPTTNEPPAREEPAREHHAINLFSTSAISAAVPSLAAPGARDPGGHTLRAGDGHGAPGGRDVVADREEASSRIHEFFDSAANDERLRAGRVAPRWREAERTLAEGFHPPPVEVSDDGSVAGFFKQWLATHPEGGTTSRADDPSRDSGFLGYGGGGPGAKMSDPGNQLRVRTEVEVVVGKDGRVRSSRVVMRSGRRKYDQAALQAVREAVEGKGALDEGGTVVTRWLVESWLQVAPPAPAMGFTFDESTGKMGADYPMKKSVKTKVALLSVKPLVE